MRKNERKAPIPQKKRKTEEKIELETNKPISKTQENIENKQISNVVDDQNLKDNKINLNQIPQQQNNETYNTGKLNDYFKQETKSTTENEQNNNITNKNNNNNQNLIDDFDFFNTDFSQIKNETNNIQNTQVVNYMVNYMI